LTGCAGFEPATETTTTAEQVRSDTTIQQTVRESAKVREASDDLNRQISQITPRPAQAPAKPDPRSLPLDGVLNGKRFSLTMQDARIGQLLWVVATEYNLGLSIDPAVLESSKTVNLYLKGVTGRQAVAQILEAFDVHGRIDDDKVLRVMPAEERIFSLGWLAARTNLGMSTGGDALGSGTKEGGSGLRDSMLMTGEFGDDKNDPWTNLSKAVEAVLAEGAPAASGQKAGPAGRFILDRTSSSLYIQARPSKVKVIEKLLENGRNYRARQLHIEVQLLDVLLNDASQLGINWTVLGRNVVGNIGGQPASLASESGRLSTFANLNDRFLTIPAQVVGIAGASDGGGLSISNKVLSATINALKAYGTVRMISNPSIRVRNGVPAYLSVGTNYRYIQSITSNASTSGNGGAGVLSTTVQTDSLFSGVVLGLGAVVKEDDSIELFIRPTQSQVTNESLLLVDVGNGNKVTLPVINSKSITTMLNMRDGDVIVMGGLIDQQSYQDTRGVPMLSELPGVGGLFRSKEQLQGTRELVMVLRARVLPN
jgi:general secretion pathway protein D